MPGMMRRVGVVKGEALEEVQRDAPRGLIGGETGIDGLRLGAQEPDEVGGGFLSAAAGQRERDERDCAESNQAVAVVRTHGGQGSIGSLRAASRASVALAEGAPASRPFGLRSTGDPLRGAR